MNIIFLNKYKTLKIIIIIIVFVVLIIVIVNIIIIIVNIIITYKQTDFDRLFIDHTEQYEQEGLVKC